ncbi:helix-turn-helix transcriptional regulator [Oscillatoria sp. HE19RPO]|uniref:helix-turn-helix transcriptional regulator n=1 Tax=Oscillatoria sp. HE19RPO TaxID=2954806 RepID=UPI0020C34522|nr:helix-turn-helix transcriptional regulator [Oscillatoria sp. HE19RPO]
MAFSLGKRLKATRESLGLTQEQVIEQLEIRYGVSLSQQAMSSIENGKRKVDAERELPALAAVYGQAIDSFYDSWALPEGGKSQKRAFAAPAVRSPQDVRAIATVDLEALTKRDMLELAAELIYNVLEEP